MDVFSALIDPGKAVSGRDFLLGAAILAATAACLHILQAFSPLALAGLWLIVWMGLIYPALCLFSNRARAAGRHPGIGAATASLIFVLLLILSGFVIPGLLTAHDPALFDPARLARAALIPNILITIVIFAAAVFWAGFWDKT